MTHNPGKTQAPDRGPDGAAAAWYRRLDRLKRSNGRAVARSGARGLVTTVTALIFGVGLSACSRPEPPPEPVRAVKLLTVAPQALQAQTEYAGEVRARVESRLGFRVGGQIVQRFVSVGDAVRPGQVLAELDGRDLRLAAESAEAQVAAAQTQRDLAAADLRRFESLQAQGFISGAELERRRASLEAAEASLRQARAGRAVQGNQAGYARLLADAPGVVVAVEAEAGQVVSAGATVLRLARDGAREVQFALPEDRRAWVRPGLAAQVRLWADAAGAGVLEGTVREVAASADPITRTFAVRVALPPTAEAPLGATAYVRLPTPQAAPEAVRLPTSALTRSADGNSVWLYDEATQTVQPRNVQVAGVEGNEVLVAAGLRPGELVVAAGVHVLAPGQKVVRFVGAGSR